MKKYTFCFLLVLSLTGGFSARAQQTRPTNVGQEFARAARQYERMLAAHPNTTRFPHSSKPDGSAFDQPSSWWCSGFFGGSLWHLYQYTKDSKWKTAAHRWTMAMAKEQRNTSMHDLGFMLYCPFGNGYRLTQNPVYRQVMLTGANSLATRFDPKIGLIKSWEALNDRPADPCGYPVIIDNMMNLEFLLWAATASGNPQFRTIALTHADNTLTHQFRPDHSSYHVICYNPDGTVAMKRTRQGYADSSAWARGQAWGLYGYTVMYRETKDKKYLTHARRIADFYLNHPNLPADKIPYWDFNAPDLPNEERDASAGAITAAALLELCTYGGTSDKRYYESAVQMLQSLASPAYRAKLGENNNFLLKHSVGFKPAGKEVDVPLVYADYYYLEALLRYDALRKKSPFRS